MGKACLVSVIWQKLEECAMTGHLGEKVTGRGMPNAKALGWEDFGQEAGVVAGLSAREEQ